MRRRVAAAAAATVAVAGVLALAALGCALVGCSGGSAGDAGSEDGGGGASADAVQVLTASEAHDLMTSDRVVILDVRTQEEYDAAHIVNARLLPLDDIDEDAAAAAAPDKDALALVYCRTGVRSAEAAAKLAALGYTQVRDFGGIQSWPYGTIDAPEADAGTVDNDELPVGVKVVCGKTKPVPESEG